VDRPGKPSLTLDFIEEFRPVVVDRTIFGLANKNVSFDFDENKMLTKKPAACWQTRSTNVSIQKHHEGKRIPSAIIQVQAHLRPSCDEQLSTV
jgi:CRISPR-associated protein Cas1